ncbi:hypothetical protein HYALB_00011846 [Hymenoscyphus albidus]|uniref:Leucine-rich repeat domain-containing protein n=1 Tax=Hymenoscyphus albidus TaxID=595503 RepID=A0A9N9LYN9_9HELO|nr:hypothetical protein HYALB_00011846 [Hymenoscyphus albidus]
MRDASLEGLSDELILEIIKHLSFIESSSYYQESNSTAKILFSLGRCCHRFYGLVLPFAYSHFYQSEGNKCSIFLCRILESPALANYVKSLTITSESGWEEQTSGSCDRNSAIASWDEEELSRVRIAIEEASQSSKDAIDWFSELKKGTWDAWIAVLLSRLPNLEVLDIHQVYDRMDHDTQPWLLKFLTKATKLQNTSSTSVLALNKLREVSIYQEEESAIKSIEARAFLNLQSVKTFAAHPLDGEDIDWEDDNYRFATTDLTFSFDYVHDEPRLAPGLRPLARLLRCFPSLESLHVDRQDESLRISQAHVTDFMQIMSHLQDTLKELHLFAIDSPESSIGSLADFEKLKTLSVAPSLLTGSALDTNTGLPYANIMMESLPRALGYLNFWNITQQEAPSIIALIQNKDKYTPSLRSLTLEWVEIRYPDEKKNAHPLSEVLFKHPGFTREQACDLWQDCQAKNVEIVTKVQSPPTKFVAWPYNKEIPKFLPKETTASREYGAYGKYSQPVFNFPWPYDGFEDFVKEQGYDMNVKPTKLQDWGTYGEDGVGMGPSWDSLQKSLEVERLARGY